MKALYTALIARLLWQHRYFMGKLRRVAGGALLAAVCVWLGMITFLFLLLGLFFQLAQMFHFVEPALFAALIAFLLGTLLAVQSYRLLH